MREPTQGAPGRARPLAACLLALAACDGGRREVLGHHADGEPRAEGGYRAGERHGPWTTWYEGGGVASRGSYLFGAQEGVWVHRQPDGTLDSERSGVYEAGRKVADYFIDGAILERKDGRIKERLEVVDGVQHGLATSYWPDGTQRCEGRHERGRRTGRWTFWKPDGSVDRERSGVYDGWRRVAP